jgi:hypothetical protein
MDGQHDTDGPERPGVAADDIAEMQRFMGYFTGAGNRGVQTDSGERPDNVRRLDAHRERRTKELD